MTNENPKAPVHLRHATRKWWDSVVADYDLDDSLLKTLQLAAEAWDRCCEAREAIAKLGITFEDRFKQPKVRPEVAVERDSRIGFLRAMRELALDVSEPAEELSRPPTIRGNSSLKVAGE